MIAYDPDISNNIFSWDICGNKTSAYGSIDISGGGDIQNSKGSWKYTLDYNSVAYKTLRQGSVYFDKFYARVLDDLSANAVQEIIITVVGINDAPSDISGNTALTLTKGSTSMNGTFFAVDDDDLSGNFFWDISGDKIGKYGTIDIAGINTNKTTGRWVYELYNNSNVYKQLRDNETGVDTFTIRVWDDLGANTTKQLSITVVGQNDPPIIATTGNTGSIIIRNNDDTNLQVTNTLIASDIDLCGNFTWDISGINTGDYGSITIDSSGNNGQYGIWTYTSNNDFSKIGSGATQYDTFIAVVTDDLGLSVEHSTNIVVSIRNLINVYFTTYEDTYIKITFNDIVSSAFGFNNGIDESFIITAVSADTYTLTLGSNVASAIPFDLTNNNNNKIDASTNAFWTSKPYANGDIPAFTIKSKNNLGDESSDSVIISINVIPVNNPPEISSSSDISGNITTNQNVNSLNGNMFASDVDLSGNLTWTVAAAANADGGNYGTMMINSNTGVWVYNIDYTEMQRVNVIHTDRFIATVSDYLNASDTVFITIVITGGVNNIISFPTTVEDTSGVEITFNNILHSQVVSDSGVDFHNNGSIKSYIITAINTANTKTLKLGSTEESAVLVDLTSNNSNNKIDASTNAYWTPAENANGELPAFTIISKNTLGHESTESVTININVTPVNDPPVILVALSDICGNITTNDNSVTSLTGTMFASDVDLYGNLTWNVADASDSNFGTMTIDSNTGVWIYNLGYTTAMKQLNVGEEHRDVFTTTVSDYLNASDTEDITIVITGGVNNIIPFPTTFEDSSGVVITFNNILHSEVVSNSSANFHNGSMKSYIITAVNEANTKTLKLGPTEASAVLVDLTSNNSNNKIDASTNAYWTPAANANGELPAFTIISKNTLGQESTESVTININVTPVNDQPVIILASSDISGNITTNDNSVTSLTGTMFASDIDLSGNLTWTVSDASGSNYGTMTIDSNTGVWVYNLEYNTITQQLNQGDTHNDVFTATVSDYLNASDSEDITIFITGGINYIIPFPSTVEDTSGGVVITFNNILHSEVVSNSGANFHNNRSIKSYIITAVSAYTYTLKLGPTEESAVLVDLISNNSNNKIDASTNAYWTPIANANGDLPAFTIISKNVLGQESTESVTININVTPVNDLPVILVASSDISGNITTYQNVTSLTGTLVASDVDLSGNFIWTVADASDSNYGTMTIDSNTGVWVYDLSNNTVIQQLNVGETHTDVFTATVRDYYLDMDSSANVDITIVITGGTNNIIGFPSTVEDTSGVVITFNNILHSQIVSDSGANFHNNGSVNSYIITAVSTDTYTLKLGLTEELAEAFDLSYNEIDDNTNAYWTPAENANGELPAFTIISKNISGTESSESVTIKINVTPVNDPPVIILALSDISRNITTNQGYTSLTGKLVASDVDLSGNLTWTVADAAAFAGSNYGTMTIDSHTGIWIYNYGYNTAIQHINVGDTHTDVFTATVSEYLDMDSSANVDITIVITGGVNNVLGFPGTVEDSSGGVVITHDNIFNRGFEFYNNGSIDSYIITAVSTDTYTLKLGLTEELAEAFDLSYNEIDENINAYWTPTADANGELTAFTVNSKNTLGSESTDSAIINIIVTPVNDPPVIIPSLSDISGNISTTQLSVTGKLVTLDVDVSDNLTWSVNGNVRFIDSSYGRLSIDSSGISSGLYRNWIWTYDICNNSMTQSLYTGNSATEVFAVKVTDSSGSYATQNITINITGSGSIPSSSLTGYTWALQTNTLNNQLWSSVSVSNNGQYSVAVSEQPGYVYTSLDYGVSWTRRDPSGTNVTGNWKACAISYDGSKIVVAQYGGYLYMSSNSGISWVTTGSIQNNWNAVSISDNGNKISAVAYGSNIYTYNGTIWSSPSTDTSGNSLTGLVWSSITLSSDGSKIAACALSNYIYISADSGSTWKRITSVGSKSWKSIVMSSDGSKLAAVDNTNGYIYKSSDYGITWSQTNAPLGYWLSISMSSDGSKMVAVGNDTINKTYVYISYDFGISWISQTSANLKLWNSIAISKDGLYIAAVSKNDYISVASYPEVFTLNSNINTNTVTTFQDISGNGKKNYVVQFYSNNTITMKQNIDASYIIIGGGAGGILSTSSYGGGAGAGGSVLQGTTHLSVGTGYIVTIGNGGSVGVKGVDSSFNSIVASGGAIGTLQNGGVGVNGVGSGGNGSYSSSGNTVAATSGAAGATLPFTMNMTGVAYTQLANGGNGMAINGTATSTIANTGNGGGSSQSGGSGIVILYFSI